MDTQLKKLFITSLVLLLISSVVISSCVPQRNTATINKTIPIKSDSVYIKSYNYLMQDDIEVSIIGNDTNITVVVAEDNGDNPNIMMTNKELTDLKTGKKYITLTDKYFLFEGKDTVLRSKYWEDYNNKK